MRSRRTRDEQGLALITVIGATAALTALLLVTTSYAITSMKFSRNDQDRQAALAAAEAGVDHYLQKLNEDNTYYLTVDCDNPALRGPTTAPNACGYSSTTPKQWLNVDGRPNAATFNYRAITTDTLSTGAITLVSTGRVLGEERTVQVTLRRKSFLDFLYFSDKETLDPPLQASIPNCNRYRYAGRDTRCSVIRWVTQDTLKGPLHTNDTLVVDGNPTFNGLATTAWADPTRKYWFDNSASGTSSPNFVVGGKPSLSGLIPIPSTNIEIRKQTDPAITSTPGCRYYGATRVKLLPGSSAKGDGRMQVWSPNTLTPTTPSCRADGTVVPLPQNGVLYVDPLPAATTAPAPPVTYANTSCSQTRPHVTEGTAAGAPGYPQPGDVGNQPGYDCRQANAYVSGTLDGQLTIASEHNVVVVGDTVYESGTCPTCTDVLGLVGTQYVWLYHPVRALGAGAANDLPRPDGTLFNNPRVEAAIASNNHSFMVQNYASGGPRSGALNITGAIIQSYRGPVGTSSGGTPATGYAKNYKYDDRLKILSPPYFLKPEDTAWQTNSYSEQ